MVLTVEEKLDGREVWMLAVVVEPVKLVVEEWLAVVDVELLSGVVLDGPLVDCGLVDCEPLVDCGAVLLPVKEVVLIEPLVE